MDIVPLSGLTNLRGLISFAQQDRGRVRRCRAWTNLTHLFLDNNSIADVSPLSNLTNLTYLILSGQRHRGCVAAVGLNQLGKSWIFGATGSRMCRRCRGLSNLTYLHYDDTPHPRRPPTAGDCGCLGQGERCADLRGGHGDFDQTARVSEGVLGDLTGLELATNLIELELGRNAIADVAPLSGLTNLTQLDLHSNSIADCGHRLAGLTHLEYLSLGGNKIAEVSPLTGLPQPDSAVS